MRSIPDVNVLLPLIARGHPAHAAALDWFDGQSPHSAGWCVLTRLGLLRLLSNSRVMGADVLSPLSALAIWDTLSSDERFEEVENIPPSHEEVFRRILQGRAPTPNLWTDAWLAALAESSGRKLVTFDRGFREFGLSHLEILEARLS